MKFLKTSYTILSCDEQLIDVFDFFSHHFFFLLFTAFFTNKIRRQLFLYFQIYRFKFVSLIKLPSNFFLFVNSTNFFSFLLETISFQMFFVRF